MPDKVLVLTAVWANEHFVVGVFTSSEKLKVYLDKHPTPEIAGVPLAEYDERLEVKVDAE